MTVAAKAPIAEHLENGVTASFPAPFRFLDASDLEVTRIGAGGSSAVLPRGVAWTAAGGATDQGGAVTVAPSFLASGTTLRIRRVTARAQKADYTTADTFPAESHEAALDRQMMIAQEQDAMHVDLADRSLTVPIGEQGFQLPPAAERVGYAAWQGGQLVGAPLPTGIVGANILATVSSRAMMAALTGVTPGVVVYLDEGARSGFFVARPGVLNFEDPLQGLYVQAVGHYWARIWDDMNGRPEWWGAVSGFTGDGGLDAIRATANLLALNACVDLCRIVHLKGDPYVLNDTWWISKPHVSIRGTSAAIEDGNGTMMVQLDRTKNIIRVGGTSMSDLRARISIEQVGVRWWNGGPVPAENPIHDPRGFDVRYCLAADLDYPFVFDPVLGFYFYGNIATHVRNSGATRFSRYGLNDRYRGYWCGGGGPDGSGGSLPGFAGQNASLYFHDINSTMGGDAQAASIQDLPAVGLFADGDFADLFVDGFETSGVPRSLHLDGTGFVGHWDTRFNRLTFDQGDEDGCIKIEGTSPRTKIKFNDVYLQFNQGADDSPSAGSNRAIWIENTGGMISFANLELLGGGDKCRGVYTKNAANIVFTETCVIDGPAYPVTADVGCKNFTFKGTIFDGGNSSGGTRAAISIVASVGADLRPTIQSDGPSSFSAGINFIGSAHVSATMDATKVDIGAISDGRKVVINGQNITTVGSFAADGSPTTAGHGIVASGVIT
jgi:hypothetical protein